MVFASLLPPLRALLRAHGVIDRNNDNNLPSDGSDDDGSGDVGGRCGGDDDDVVVIDDLDDALEWCEEQVRRMYTSHADELI